MDISFDPAKNVRNIEVHGISFERAKDFDWETALNREDIRHDYREQRFRALGFIDSRIHVLIHTPREGCMHVISLRKANKREVRSYEDEAKSETTGRGS